MKELEDVLESTNVKYNEPMSKHTSLKVGGYAEIFAYVDSVEKLQKVLKICKEKNIKVTVIGNGSNILVLDEGIKGLVIKYIANEINIMHSLDVVVSGGVINAVLAEKLLSNSLTGFEFASRYTRNSSRSSIYECWCLWQRNKRCSNICKIY